ncbi:Domain of unknown function DUF4211 domain-containing protein [Strongyloides ratti]|uniref:DUF4211 domain-containing protein n=1 Tax=Strongyloides ratti TaxID=34506 RepID=A0A090MMQ7_STRRB|nr:Domain of unknown function DUF4211 domain-containing protein [Strongyloides ratti]CEF59301.1 Domain of unknown function DUF4211 domain-containing protein [Strongyloides ratti]
MEQRNLGTSVPSTFTPNTNNYNVLKNGFNKTPINFHNNFSNLHSTNDMLLMSLQQQLNELSNTNVPSAVDIHNSSKLILQNDLHSSPQYTTKTSWNDIPKDKWNVQKNLECQKQHINYNNTFNTNLSSPNLLINAKINDNRSPIETPPFSMTPHNIVQNGNTTFQNSPNVNSLYNVRQQPIKRSNINSNIWSPYNNLNIKTPMMKSSNNIINEISNQSINSPTNNISHDISSIHNQKTLNQNKKFNINNSNDFSQHCYNMNQLQINNNETTIDDNTSPSSSSTSSWGNIERNNFGGYSLKTLQIPNNDNNMFQKISDTINSNKINFENSISSQYNNQKDIFNNTTNDINNTITNFSSTMNDIKKSNNILENLGEQQEQLSIIDNKKFDHINDLADVDKEFEQILSSVARKESTSANNNIKEYSKFSNTSSNIPKNNELNNSNNSLNINKESKVPIVDLTFLAPLPLNNTIVLTEFPSTSSSKSSENKFGLSGTINFTPPGSPTITDKNDSYNSFFVPFSSSSGNNYLNTNINNITSSSSIISQENLNKSNEGISTISTQSILSNNIKNKIKNKDINKGTVKKSLNCRTKKTKDLENDDINILLDKEQKEKEEKEFLDSLLFMPNKNNRNNCNVVPIYKQKSKPCYAEASTLMKEDLLKGKNAVDEYDFVDDEPEEILPKTVISCDDDSEDDTNNLSSKNKQHGEEKNCNSNDNESNSNINQKSRKYNEKAQNNNKDKIQQSNGISLLRILKERKINDHHKILTNNNFIKHEICFKEHDIKFDNNKIDEIKDEINNENTTLFNNNEIDVIRISNNNEKKNNIIGEKNICIPPLKVLSMLAVDKKSPSIDENIMPAIPKLRIKIFKQEKIISKDNDINNSNNKKKKKRKLDKDEDYIYDTKNSKKKKRKRVNDDDCGYSNESTNYKAQIIMFEEHGYIEYGKKDSLTVDEWNSRDKTNYTRFNDKKIDKNTNILMKIKHIAPSTYISERLKMFEEASEGIGKGTFLIHKSDLSKDDIPLWKVDSQNLLQKFPALKDNNKNRTYMYKSSSTYSGWCDQLINEYMIINVNVVKQSRSECIVELPLPINDLFPVMSTIDIKDINIFKDSKISKDISSNNEENKLILSKDDKVVENMLIYIEALLNHAISNTFLDKVKQGNDWNFLLAINEIDRINNEAKERVKQRVKWTEKIEITINEFLYCSIIDGIIFNYNKKDGKNHCNNVNIQCQACGMRSSEKIIQFFEKCIYNKETLEIEIDKNINEKDDVEELSAIDFHICEMCADLGEIYHRLTHMRFLTFMVCEQKLEELCMLDENVLPSKAISICLKDFKWLNAIMSDYYEIWKRIQRNDI